VRCKSWWKGRKEHPYRDSGCAASLLEILAETLRKKLEGRDRQSEVDPESSQLSEREEKERGANVSDKSVKLQEELKET